MKYLFFSHKQRLSVGCISIVLLLFMASYSFAKNTKERYAKSQIIIKFKDSVLLPETDPQKKQLQADSLPISSKLINKYQIKSGKKVFKNKLKTIRKLQNKTVLEKHNKKLARIYVFKISEDIDPMEAAKDIAQDPNIEYAEPNYKREILTNTPNNIQFPNQWASNNTNQSAMKQTKTVATTPDDTYFSNQWALHNTGQTGGTNDADIDATEAWDITTGSTDVVVAILDTGLYFTHNDVRAENLWENTGEIPDNSTDDDANGYTDDRKAWDFSGNVDTDVAHVTPDKDPSDYHGHGSHCAGIVGAHTNNSTGISGVCWNVRLMILKTFPNSYSSILAEAIAYAVNNGANIISMSYGSDDLSQTEKNAVDAAHAAGVLLIAAAGNSGEEKCLYPAALDNVMAIAATNSADIKWTSSNYGSTITVSAPGKSIYSLGYPNEYAYMSGTSMATPMTAGVAALVFSANPSLTNTEIRNILCSTADDIDTLNPSYAEKLGAGRVNAYEAVRYAVGPPPVFSYVYDGLSSDIDFSSSTSQLSANWSASDAESGISKYSIAIGSTPGGTNIKPWTDNGLNTSTSTTGLSLLSGTTYYFSIKAENILGNSAIQSSDGILIDTHPPSITFVNDGLDSDIDSSVFLDRLSANWNGTDAESGIFEYQFAIGTSTGGTDIKDWTSNGSNISTTTTGLSLSFGTTYYVSIKAVDNTGNISSLLSSNGAWIETDGVSPTVIFVNDGLSADIAYSSFTDRLSANWNGTDAESGIAGYRFGIGSTPGSTDIKAWTDNGLNTSATTTGLSLTNNTTYYFSVKAYDHGSNTSTIVSSNGVLIDTIAPRGQVTIIEGTTLATGKINIKLEIIESNEIDGTPILSYLLSDGTTIPLSLAKSENIWRATSYIESTMSDGIATFVLSCNDKAGNTGTAIISGSTFDIQKAVAQTGGNVSNEDGAEVTIPADTFTSSVTIAITDASDKQTIVNASIASLKTEQTKYFISTLKTYRDITIQTIATSDTITQTEKNVGISIPYPDTNQDGTVDGTTIQESTLIMAYLDEITNEWKPLARSEVNTSSNIVTGYTNHFSIFAVVPLLSIGNQLNIYAYPNPCNMNNSKVNITNIPLNAQNIKIHIYNIVGELVRVLDDNDVVSLIGRKRIEWDGYNNTGNRCASGVYIYVLSCSKGTTVRKIALLW